MYILSVIIILKIVRNLIIPLIEKDIMILSFSIFFIITFKEYFEYTKLL